jgi:hypothetical protein
MGRIIGKKVFFIDPESLHIFEGYSFNDRVFYQESQSFVNIILTYLQLRDRYPLNKKSILKFLDDYSRSLDYGWHTNLIGRHVDGVEFTNYNERSLNDLAYFHEYPVPSLFINNNEEYLNRLLEDILYLMYIARSYCKTKEIKDILEYENLIYPYSNYDILKHKILLREFR